jgi:hypothetical protein
MRQQEQSQVKELEKVRKDIPANENETPSAKLEERRIAAIIARFAKDALARFTSIPTRIRQHVRKFRPDWYILIRRHWDKHGHFPRLIRARTFNDKVLHRMLFDRRAVLTQVANKAAVRDYVEARLGRHLLAERYTSQSTPTPFRSISFLTDLSSSPPTVPAWFRSSPTNRHSTGRLS